MLEGGIVAPMRQDHYFLSGGCGSAAHGSTAASPVGSASNRKPPGIYAEMGLFRRIFGPATDTTPSVIVEDGHTHAPDADPDDVVLPKEKKSSATLVAGKPPLGWKRQASEAAGGVWPWGAGDSPQGHHFGSGDSGGSSASGD